MNRCLPRAPRRARARPGTAGRGARPTGGSTWPPADSHARDFYSQPRSRLPVRITAVTALPATSVLILCCLCSIPAQLRSIPREPRAERVEQLLRDSRHATPPHRPRRESIIHSFRAARMSISMRLAIPAPAAAPPRLRVRAAAAAAAGDGGCLPVARAAVRTETAALR